MIIDSWSIFYLIAGYAIVFVIAYLLKYSAGRYLQKFVINQPKIRTTYTFMIRLLLFVVSLIGVAVVTFIVFPQAGSVVASIFVAAGFASIVIGLAAQPTLSNFVSGLIVSVSQPFTIGDAVVFKGDFCFVEDVKIMHSVFRTWDNRRLVIPNSAFQSEVIINYSMEDPTMLVPVFAHISYESDLKKAMEIMVDIAKRHPECKPIGNLPNAVVMEFAESGVSLRLLSRAKDQPTAFMMARDLLYQIKIEFEKNGIEIPYPRRYLIPDKRLKEQISEMTHSMKSLLSESHWEHRDDEGNRKQQKRTV